MKLQSILIFLLLTSCGKVKVTTDLPDQVKFGPNFEEASLFCDNRYGYQTVESEACFQDYRTFLSPKITLDLASIRTFCKGSYSDQEEIEECEKDILAIIKNTIKD